MMCEHVGGRVRRYADGNGAFAELRWLTEDIRRNFAEWPWDMFLYRCGVVVRVAGHQSTGAQFRKVECAETVHEVSLSRFMRKQ